MFNMVSIGSTISELRKKHNMTQMELADKLNISFQAVSNWERGNSMPDISKLPELARLFDVTIDDLLGEKSELIENIANNTALVYLENNSVTPAELERVAPLLKPEQADSIVANAKLDLSDIAGILPFISRDAINELALKAEAEENYSGLCEMAPFISRDAINDIAQKRIDTGKSIADIAPFVSRETIAKLALTGYEKNGLSSFEDFVPFIPSNTLQSIAEKEYAANGLNNFDAIAPFLNRDYLSGLAKSAIEKDGIRAITPLAPFLDRNMLSEYVKENFL